MHSNPLQEEIIGLIDDIVYYNATNGYGVLRVKKSAQDTRSIAAVGTIPQVAKGQQVKITGTWVIDKKFGKQLKIEALEVILPKEIEGIRKYLSSGLIYGIGTSCANWIVSHFGIKTFEIIDKEPHRLLEIRGIGKVRVDKIIKSWQEQRVIKDIMLFLQEHGIGNSLAIKIYKAYGQQAIEVIKANPYCLAKDIYGIGFLTADKIALCFGIEPSSAYRIKAAIDYILNQNALKGNSVVPRDALQIEIQQLLSVSIEAIIQNMQSSILEGSIIETNIFLNNKHNDERIHACALGHFFEIEKAIATKLLLLSKHKDQNEIDYAKAIEYAQSTLKITLADNQKEAIRKIITEQVIVVTGGPGTGKTTLLNSAVKILQQAELNVMLCAPTGKAAKRLSEVSSCPATTIHRMLGINPYDFQIVNQQMWQECDVLIVDEVSMVDIVLLRAITKAISNQTKLILVGDINQLPPIGAGKPLADIIDSRMISVVKLDKIFRQEEAGMIVVNAHKINNGIMPDLGGGLDFKFLPRSNDHIASALISCIEQLPQRYSLLKDVQVLTPMRKTDSGAIALNNVLQKSLNKEKRIKISRFGNDFYNNDKVMQIVNNYQKDVYNGDVGIIVDIDLEEQTISVDFDDKKVSYEINQLDQLVLAYASTIHKSQGSEYKVVIIPVSTQHQIMLNRKLLYTAITRAKEMVILIGSQYAIEVAINAADDNMRFSKLRDFLIESAIRPLT
jgi:exodeoxyribonuclease V alpha subunit